MQTKLCYRVVVSALVAAFFSAQNFAQTPPADDDDFPIAAILQAISPTCSALSIAPNSVAPGAAITLSAACTNLVESYEWRLNGTLIPGAPNTSASFSTAAPLASGTYTYSVVGRRGNLLSQPVSAAATVLGAANVAPTVSISAPTAGASIAAGTTVQIAAVASDSDGTIAKVEFYDGATKLGEDVVAPFTLTWTNPTLGTHTLTARATDNSGAQTVSAAVALVITEAPPVAPNETPAAQLTATGFPYVAPAAANLTLSLASGLSTGETITRLRWYENGALIETIPSPSGATWTKTLSLNAANYEYYADILTSSNRLITSNKTQIVVSPTVAGAPDVFQPEQTGAGVPGTLPGMAEVSSSGGMSYSVPIAIPPGIAGVAPNLAISYSSQGNNGPLGMGWAVQGFSSIHRCPKTIYSDGVRGKINYDANDRYCMDGARLVQTGAVGGNIEYKTEVDSYTRVVGYGPSAGHAYFQVWTKDGRILTFGNTTDSILRPAGSAFTAVIKSWALNRVEDRVGNYISYTYTLDTGNQLPDTINYTGNSVAATSPFANVKFNYELRAPDDQTTLFDSKGAPSTLTQRLASIVTSTDGSAVKKYKFTYSVSARTYRTVLASMQECSGDEATCFTATTFQPGTTPTSPSAFDETSLRPFGQTSSVSPSFRQPFVADFNGDGKSDALNQTSDQTWELCLANSDGHSQSCQVVSLPQLPFNDPTNASIAYRYLIEVGDFNGDGKIDVLMYPNNVGFEPVPDEGGTGGIAAPTGEENFAKAAAAQSGDSSGLFRLRPGRLTATRGQLIAAQARRNANPSLAPARFGTTAPNEWKLCLSTGTDFDCQIKALVDPGVDIPGVTVKSRVGDFNGDGRTDFMTYIEANNASNLRSCLADGSAAGFVCAPTPNVLPDHTVSEVQVGDLDGDGRADLLVWNPSNGDPLALSDEFRSCVSTSTGMTSSFSCQNINIFHSRHDFGIATSDFNGDGITDLMFYPNTPTAPATQSYYVCLGRGDGTFTMPDGSRCKQWTSPFPESFNDRTHVIGDFNVSVQRPPLPIPARIGQTRPF